jgi:hypothetical protein
LVWFSAGVVLAIIMPPNLNRINVLYPPLLFFAAAGLESLWSSRPIFWALVAAYVASFVGLLFAYFETYPAKVGPAFFASIDEAIDDASSASPGRICVTDHVNYGLSYTFGLDLCRGTPIGAYVIEAAEIPSLPAGSYSLTSFNRYVVAVPREVGSER